MHTNKKKSKTSSVSSTKHESVKNVPIDDIEEFIKQNVNKNLKTGSIASEKNNNRNIPIVSTDNVIPPIMSNSSSLSPPITSENLITPTIPTNISTVNNPSIVIEPINLNKKFDTVTTTIIPPKIESTSSTIAVQTESNINTTTSHTQTDTAVENKNNINTVNILNMLANSLLQPFPLKGNQWNNIVLKDICRGGDEINSLCLPVSIVNTPGNTYGMTLASASFVSLNNVYLISKFIHQVADTINNIDPITQNIVYMVNYFLGNDINIDDHPQYPNIIAIPVSLRQLIYAFSEFQIENVIKCSRFNGEIISHAPGKRPTVVFPQLLCHRDYERYEAIRQSTEGLFAVPNTVSITKPIILYSIYDFITAFNQMISNVFQYYRPHGVYSYNARASATYVSNVAKEIWLRDIEQYIDFCGLPGKEYCWVCGLGIEAPIVGDLVGCSNDKLCNRWFHQRCHKPSITEEEKLQNPWYCVFCSSGIEQSTNPIANISQFPPATHTTGTISTSSSSHPHHSSTAARIETSNSSAVSKSNITVAPPTVRMINTETYDRGMKKQNTPVQSLSTRNVIRVKLSPSIHVVHPEDNPEESISSPSMNMVRQVNPVPQFSPMNIGRQGNREGTIQSPSMSMVRQANIPIGSQSPSISMGRQASILIPSTSMSMVRQVNHVPQLPSMSMVPVSQIMKTMDTEYTSSKPHLSFTRSNSSIINTTVTNLEINEIDRVSVGAIVQELGKRKRDNDSESNSMIPDSYDNQNIIIQSNQAIISNVNTEDNYDINQTTNEIITESKSTKVSKIEIDSDISNVHDATNISDKDMPTSSIAMVETTSNGNENTSISGDNNNNNSNMDLSAIGGTTTIIAEKDISQVVEESSGFIPSLRSMIEDSNVIQPSVGSKLDSSVTLSGNTEFGMQASTESIEFKNEITIIPSSSTVLSSAESPSTTTSSLSLSSESDTSSEDDIYDFSVEVVTNHQNNETNNNDSNNEGLQLITNIALASETSLFDQFVATYTPSPRVNDSSSNSNDNDKDNIVPENVMVEMENYVEESHTNYDTMDMEVDSTNPTNNNTNIMIPIETIDNDYNVNTLITTLESSRSEATLLSFVSSFGMDEQASSNIIINNSKRNVNTDYYDTEDDNDKENN